MVMTVTTKGQALIPAAIRKQARVKAGDQLDVGYVNGLVVMRKRTPLSPEQLHSLSLAALSLPALTKAEESTVAKTIQRLRARRRRIKSGTRS